MADKADNQPADGATADEPNGAAPPPTSSTIRDVEELIRLMVDNDLMELNIEEGPRKILLKRRGPEAPAVAGLAVGPIAPPAALAATAAPYALSGSGEAVEEPDSELVEIKSPMVGTFYAASGPDTPDFVSVGDTIDVDDVVCIVEAMKVMNEIKADCSGTIAEICVENAQPVEFGQVLYRVRPT